MFVGEVKKRYKSMNYLFHPTPSFLTGFPATPKRDDVTFGDCKLTCDQTNECQSFSFCKDGSCHLHKKYLQGTEDSLKSGVEQECFTSFVSGMFVGK